MKGMLGGFKLDALKNITSNIHKLSVTPNAVCEGFTPTTYTPPKFGGIIIEVRVYALLDVRPIWHTGTRLRAVANDPHITEFYFHVTNRVQGFQIDSAGFPAPHHRTLTREVPGDWSRIIAEFNRVRDRWNGTRYDIFRHNCNLFTDDLLKSLGGRGLDREYVDSSGIRTFLEQMPGTAILMEIFKGGPNGKYDQAIWADAKSSAQLAAGILGYLYPGQPAASALERLESEWPALKKRPGNSIADGAKYYGGQIAKGAQSLGNKVATAYKKI